MIPGLQIEEKLDPILKLLFSRHEDLYDAYFTALQAWLKNHETEGFFVGGHEPSGGGFDRLFGIMQWVYYTVFRYIVYEFMCIGIEK